MIAFFSYRLVSFLPDPMIATENLLRELTRRDVNQQWVLDAFRKMFRGAAKKNFKAFAKFRVCNILKLLSSVDKIISNQATIILK